MNSAMAKSIRPAPLASVLTDVYELTTSVLTDVHERAHVCVRVYCLRPGPRVDLQEDC